ncbi:MAG: stage III sporulation protein AB [Eubacteriales bacterium]|nr:stage III sporulation protein AB [Eubacteriales bacterium]MDD4421978.1 stage III sporulation protein AB [Eubacteriales bacterium]
MKIIGAITIVVCSYYIGFLISVSEQKAFSQLTGLIRLLDFLLQRITYSRENLGSIFADFKDDALLECGFLSVLNNTMGETYDTLWKKAAETLCVSPHIKKELILFGIQLGKTDFITQKERTEMCRSILITEKQASQPGLDKRKRSIRALGGLAGALIAIILL